MRFISRFGRFNEDFPLKEGTVRVPLPLSRNRPENHSHNLGKALGEGSGLLCAPFTSIPFTYLSLSPIYTFHLSIPFTSLSLYIYIYLSFYLSFSPSPSLCLLSIILFGVSNGRFRPCYYILDSDLVFDFNYFLLFFNNPLKACFSNKKYIFLSKYIRYKLQ